MGKLDFNIAVPAVLEDVAHGFESEVGAVAVGAQVGKEYVGQPGAGDFGYHLRGRAIRKMPLPARDALLEGPGAVGLFKKALVMVRFHDQGAA